MALHAVYVTSEQHDSNST